MKKWTVIAILAVAQFVMILDGTVMNVSISTVAKDLGTNITGMQTAITLFALTMAAFMLTGGKLGDIWGRKRAFKIGAVIYGCGSLITAVAPSLGVLLFGWSLVEGLGAVLVIPAIASLAAANYSGKDRVVAFSLIGAATGLAAAVGPIIGGFMTTYLSWRYVFAIETIIMVAVLLVAGKIADAKTSQTAHLDIPSVVLSATGMVLVVFGALQSRSWGWVQPLGAPEIGGQAITPLGISLVAYLILLGVFVLKMFYDRQVNLESSGKEPLLKVSMLKISVLRSGLTTLTVQYFTVASIFFIVPVYLQTILGYDALQTGLKLIPLSVGLLIFTMIGSKRSSVMPPRRIVRAGQIAMAIGVLLVLGSINTELKGTMFWFGMFGLGAGFGLLASQLGNVTMSAVDKSDTGQVGGLQGTFQNLGQSFGTAIAGSIFILTLTSGFTGAVQASQDLTDQAKSAITQQAEGGVGIVSRDQAEQYVLNQGGSQATAQEISDLYVSAQLESLRTTLAIIFFGLILSLILSAKLPSRMPKLN